MYLKSLKLTNFRKFGENNNLIKFVDAKDGLESSSINVAKATTLIVGKNNSGKTTITTAIDKLIGNKKFEASDFNFTYLNRLFNEYLTNNFTNFPKLEFEITIGVDDNNQNQDLVTNIIPFITIEDLDTTEFTIKIKYEISETTEFIENIKNIISSYPDNQYLRFQKYLELLADTPKQINYYNSNGDIIEKNKFKLSDLINVKVIAANKIINNTSLSTIFNKIIQYKYKTENMDDINQQIETINIGMTEKVEKSHTPYINGALHAIENQDKLEVRLSSSLTFDILMKQMIKYEYVEQGLNIPEGQFGLGYSNLMSIIGEIIDYIEQYPDDEFHSKLNLICIEEPEAFMHPQMQELFIKNINDAIKYLLDGTTKKINSQLIVTTHSSHILNSKIHTSNSFNNINYMTILDNFSHVVNLSDGNIINCNDENAINDLKFIKKHIKYKVSELFFSDAIIFVEGITEETLLNYYIDNDDDLNKYYISIFNINGAHGLVYHNLIKLLKTPTVVITDLDIKRTPKEKCEKYKENNKTKNGKCINIIDLKGRKTTNKTILNYYGKTTNSYYDICKKYLLHKSINNHTKYKYKINKIRLKKLKIRFNVFNNLYIGTQFEKINGYYATSFEEAFILENYNNDILNEVLKTLKPKIYRDIVGEQANRHNLVENSYKLQIKLSNSKSDFANELLYQLSINEYPNKEPKLPEYIQNAIDWLKHRLKPLQATKKVTV